MVIYALKKIFWLWDEYYGVFGIAGFQCRDLLSKLVRQNKCYGGGSHVVIQKDISISQAMGRDGYSARASRHPAKNFKILRYAFIRIGPLTLWLGSLC